jgi:hypothetical protein
MLHTWNEERARNRHLLPVSVPCRFRDLAAIFARWRATDRRECDSTGAVQQPVYVLRRRYYP